MINNPTPTQALLLFGLLACHGECAQAELMPAVKKADREALQKANLIGVEKPGRGLYLRLLDAGWDWAGANLSAELPPAQRTLHELLGRLGEHLSKEGETLARFIGSKPENKVGLKTKSTSRAEKAKPGKLIVPKASSRRRAKNSDKTRTKSTKPKAPSPAAVRKQIEKSYLSLTGGQKNASVRLAHLRKALPDLDRATVDVALGRILKGDKKASLMRHDDPNQLDQADRDAAFSPAGEPFHVIWIAS